MSSPSIAHQFQKENININHPHIKFTISSGPAAGYMTIVNMGEKPDKLLNIEVDFAVAELHLSEINDGIVSCLLYTSPSPRDVEESRMPSSA